MQVTTEVAKVAWIRDRSVPAGQPALGHFDCRCGGKVEDVQFGSPRHYACPSCGKTYNGSGWVVR